MSFLSYDNLAPRNFHSDATSNIYLQTFLVLEILGGLVLLPLLLFTFLFSKSTARDATVNNLLICFILLGIGSSFSLVTANPGLRAISRNWCAAQSVIIYTGLPMAATASCALVLNLAVNLYLSIYKRPWGPKWQKLRYAIVYSPYVVGAAFAIAATLVATLLPASILTSLPVFTCIFVGYNFVKATLLYAGIALVIQFLVQMAIFIVMFQNWRIIRSLHRQQSTPYAYIRISIYSTWATLSGVSALVSVFIPASPVPPLISATNPLAAFLIFGTQKDVLSVWWFCGRRKPSEFNQLASQSEKSEKSEVASTIRQESV